MPEPTSTAAAGYTLVGGAAVATALGIQPDVIVPALIGGVVALSFGERETRGRMLISVLVSAFLGAYMSPLAVAIATAMVPAIGNTGDLPARVPAAALIGAFSKSIVPMVAGWLRRRGE